MTRNTTWTGCRAESSGRTLCGAPARALRLRPARRLRPRFWGAANNGSCSGSELPRVLPRTWPRLEPLPLVIPILVTADPRSRNSISADIFQFSKHGSKRIHH